MSEHRVAVSKDAFLALMADRDHYRDALERIAWLEPRLDDRTAAVREAVDIARMALASRGSDAA